ncbi:hypothetical protein LHJ74_30060 [Streptomyces sp. N2-109]|uniref:Uncharacterized protein n=1 Tax=Streptomyces gossypii TaxID=2883101 RepID=A0ABT2K1Q8_9ACTN|nr:hypothetical protein [Streptomyces gossypii]MCT2594103.1 hypothetical protein [Streptomyces gossypii]
MLEDWMDCDYGRDDKRGGAAAEAYEREVRAMVDAYAPRMFAVVQECGRGTVDADGWIAAWGVHHEDGRTEVTSVDGRTRGSLNSPERAAWWYGRGDGMSARLVWLGRGAADDPFV